MRMKSSLCALIALALVGGLLLGLPLPAPARADGQDRPDSLDRPDGPRLPAGGPAILHRRLATSPALRNTGVWAAKPILVSGASAYRDGEFLYQDFLYDDLGDGSSPYPDKPKTYANNAADLVELRLKPLAHATAVRLTYNTLLVPKVTATTIALGASKANRAWPHGARVASPAEVFVTAHGANTEVVDAATGRPVRRNGAVSQVSKHRRQVEVRVPYSVFDPRGRTDVRVAAGTGVWNDTAGRYRAPDDGAALYNLAFRYNETTHPRGIPVATWWRDTNQSAALDAEGSPDDISQFAAKVDFTKLAARVDDDMPNQVGGVPLTGSMTRISVSHFSDGQGRGRATDQPTSCDPPKCSVEFRGDLQPYFIHVPTKAPSPGGYGLTAYLHGCGNNHHELFGSQVAEELSERGPASLVIAGGGRGRCLWYQGAGMANLFEIWADVARRYRMDPEVSTLTGYSMGGFGTLRTTTLYPDVWGRALALHPCTATGITPDAGDPIMGSLPSLRNVPLALWNSVDDPLCHYTRTREVRDDLDSRDYSWAVFTLANDHFTDITNDVLTPGIDWAGGRHVVRNPTRVTYVYNPQHERPRYGLNPNHAYWVSGLSSRQDAPGTIDVRTRGRGAGDTIARPLTAGAGVLTGGELFPALPYTFEARHPGSAPAVRPANRLVISATNIRAVTIDPRRAGVTCDADLDVTTDGPVAVRLAGCGSAHLFK